MKHRFYENTVFSIKVGCDLNYQLVKIRNEVARQSVDAGAAAGGADGGQGAQTQVRAPADGRDAVLRGPARHHHPVVRALLPRDAVGAAGAVAAAGAARAQPRHLHGRGGQAPPVRLPGGAPGLRRRRRRLRSRQEDGRGPGHRRRRRRRRPPQACDEGGAERKGSEATQPDAPVAAAPPPPQPQPRAPLPSPPPPSPQPPPAALTSANSRA